MMKTQNERESPIPAAAGFIAEMMWQMLSWFCNRYGYSVAVVNIPCKNEAQSQWWDVQPMMAVFAYECYDPSLPQSRHETEQAAVFSTMA